MSDARGIIDPFNDKNVIIFGSAYNNKCYYLHKNNNDTLNCHHFTNIPQNIKQNSVYGHECRLFEIENKNIKNNNSIHNYKQYQAKKKLAAKSSNFHSTDLSDIKQSERTSLSQKISCHF